MSPEQWKATGKLTMEDIVDLGWVHKRTYTREGTYEGKYPTKHEFEINDVYAMGGGYLTFYPETSDIVITTVDEGWNRDGPNSSVKFKGNCPTKEDLEHIHRLIKVTKL